MFSQTDKIEASSTRMMITRKRIILIVLFINIFLAVYFLIRYTNDSRIPLANIATLNETEEKWYTGSGSKNYSALVNLEFKNEKRQYQVVVSNSEILNSTVRYWDYKEKRWENDILVGDDIGYWSTIPGLFQTIRDELQKEFRDEIRVMYNDDYHIPEIIILGYVSIDGETQPESKARIQVLKYEEQAP